MTLAHTYHGHAINFNNYLANKTRKECLCVQSQVVKTSCLDIEQLQSGMDCMRNRNRNALVSFV